MSLPDEAAAVLDFWFGPDPAAYAERGKSRWFVKRVDVDEEIRQRFGALHARAAAGELHDWCETPDGCLALVIVLDQFSRNLFRDSPQAFAADAKAREIARRAIDRGFDLQLLPLQRGFLYLPFEHSESLDDQQRSLALFNALRDFSEAAEMVRYARLHYDVIKRFGRYPHRNAILKRESTDEELPFLSQPGSSF